MPMRCTILDLWVKVCERMFWAFRILSGIFQKAANSFHKIYLFYIHFLFKNRNLHVMHQAERVWSHAYNICSFLYSCMRHFYATSSRKLQEKLVDYKQLKVSHYNDKTKALFPFCLTCKFKLILFGHIL